MKAKKIVFILLIAVLLYLLWTKLMPTTQPATSPQGINTNTVSGAVGNVVSDIGKLLNAPTGSSTTGTPATT